MSSVTTSRGRPQKTEAERRTKHAKAWLTPAEYEHVVISAGGQGPGSFAREIVLKEWPSEAALHGGKRGKPADGTLLAFRLTFAEQEHLRDLASKASLAISDYIRLAVLAHTGFDAENNLLRLTLRPGLGKKLSQLAAERNQTVAEYVLAQAVEEPGAVGKGKVDAGLLMRLDQVKHSLDRIGNNVNQLTTAAHIGTAFTASWEATQRELAEERRRAAEVLEQVASNYAW